MTGQPPQHRLQYLPFFSSSTKPPRASWWLPRPLVQGTGLKNSLTFPVVQGCVQGLGDRPPPTRSSGSQNGSAWTQVSQMSTEEAFHLGISQPRSRAHPSPIPILLLLLVPLPLLSILENIIPQAQEEKQTDTQVCGENMPELKILYCLATSCQGKACPRPASLTIISCLSAHLLLPSSWCQVVPGIRITLKPTRRKSLLCIGC